MDFRFLLLPAHLLQRLRRIERLLDLPPLPVFPAVRRRTDDRLGKGPLRGVSLDGVGHSKLDVRQFHGHSGVSSLLPVSRRIRLRPTFPRHSSFVVLASEIDAD